MDANQSIKSSLIHTGLSTEKEESVRKFYQNFLRIMASASEYGLDFQFDLRMKVTPAATEEMPSAILDASASAAEERVQDMEARHKREMEGLRNTMRAECDKKCGEHDRRAYALGYAHADQKWNPVYKAVCEELELVRKEGANHQDAYIRVCKERDNAIMAQVDLKQELEEMEEDSEKLEAQIEGLRMELASAKGNLEGTEVATRAVTASSTQVVEGLRKELATTKADLIRAQDSAENLQTEVDAATVLFQAMRSDLERLNAENKALKKENEEDKQMVQRHLKEIAKQNAEMTAWEKEEIERLREENKELQKRHAGLLQLVNPTIKLMKSNPELFGGEALPSVPASPRPPAITRWRAVSEEETERAEKFLKDLATLSRPCQLVESPPSALPGLVEAEPSSSQTEGLCMALTEEQYKEMFGADLPPPIVPDEPKVCGAAGCYECPAAEPAPVVVPETTRVSCVGCGKPKPNYNHPNWPSPITKRFAKHLAKHSGLRSPWVSQDPKAIRTHEDALEYIAKRVNISVEELLQWTMKHYQSFYEPWTLVEGPNKFNTGTAPATWWC